MAAAACGSPHHLYLPQPPSCSARVVKLVRAPALRRLRISPRGRRARPLQKVFSLAQPPSESPKPDSKQPGPQDAPDGSSETAARQPGDIPFSERVARMFAWLGGVGEDKYSNTAQQQGEGGKDPAAGEQHGVEASAGVAPAGTGATAAAAQNSASKSARSAPAEEALGEPNGVAASSSLNGAAGPTALNGVARSYLGMASPSRDAPATADAGAAVSDGVAASGGSTQGELEDEEEDAGDAHEGSGAGAVSSSTQTTASLDQSDDDAQTLHGAADAAAAEAGTAAAEVGPAPAEVSTTPAEVSSADSWDAVSIMSADGEEEGGEPEGRGSGRGATSSSSSSSEVATAEWVQLAAQVGEDDAWDAPQLAATGGGLQGSVGKALFGGLLLLVAAVSGAAFRAGHSRHEARLEASRARHGTVLELGPSMTSQLAERPDADKLPTGRSSWDVAAGGSSSAGRVGGASEGAGLQAAGMQRRGGVGEEGGASASGRVFSGEAADVAVGQKPLVPDSQELTGYREDEMGLLWEERGDGDGNSGVGADTGAGMGGKHKAAEGEEGAAVLTDEGDGGEQTSSSWTGRKHRERGSSDEEWYAAYGDADYYGDTAAHDVSTPTRGSTKGHAEAGTPQNPDAPAGKRGVAGREAHESLEQQQQGKEAGGFYDPLHPDSLPSQQRQQPLQATPEELALYEAMAERTLADAQALADGIHNLQHAQDSSPQQQQQHSEGQHPSEGQQQEGQQQQMESEKQQQRMQLEGQQQQSEGQQQQRAESHASMAESNSAGPARAAAEPNAVPPSAAAAKAGAAQQADAEQAPKKSTAGEEAMAAEQAQKAGAKGEEGKADRGGFWNPFAALMPKRAKNTANAAATTTPAAAVSQQAGVKAEPAAAGAADAAFADHDSLAMVADAADAVAAARAAAAAAADAAAEADALMQGGQAAVEGQRDAVLDARKSDEAGTGGSTGGSLPTHHKQQQQQASGTVSEAAEAAAEPARGGRPAVEQYSTAEAVAGEGAAGAEQQQQQATSIGALAILDDDWEPPALPTHLLVDPPAGTVTPESLESLPLDRTMAALRQRASLAGRASRAASQSAERAASYSVAASSAASHAAEAAREAAAAASRAQHGAEALSEEVVAEAETRAADALRAARNAEDKAAEAAAHATAHQGVAEDQAGAATRAAKPPPPTGPTTGLLPAAWVERGRSAAVSVHSAAAEAGQAALAALTWLWVWVADSCGIAAHVVAQGLRTLRDWVLGFLEWIASKMH